MKKLLIAALTLILVGCNVNKSIPQCDINAMNKEIKSIYPDAEFFEMKQLDDTHIDYSYNNVIEEKGVRTEYLITAHMEFNNKDEWLLSDISEKVINETINELFKTRVIIDSLNIRDTYSTNGNILNVAKKGDVFSVYEKVLNEDYIWLKIGDNKWIANDGTYCVEVKPYISFDKTKVLNLMYISIEIPETWHPQESNATACLDSGEVYSVRLIEGDRLSRGVDDYHVQIVISEDNQLFDNVYDFYDDKSVKIQTTNGLCVYREYYNEEYDNRTIFASLKVNYHNIDLYLDFTFFDIFLDDAIGMINSIILGNDGTCGGKY